MRVVLTQGDAPTALRLSSPVPVRCACGLCAEPRPDNHGGPAARRARRTAMSFRRRGRRSEVRVNRVLRLDPGAVRREGAVLPRARFDEVAEAVRRIHGW